LGFCAHQTAIPGGMIMKFRHLLMMEAALLPLAVLIARASQVSWSLGAWRTPAVWILSVVSFGLPWWGLKHLTRSHWPPFARLTAFMVREVAPWFAGTPRWKLALLSLTAGISEEVLFRGVLHNMFAGGLGTTGAVFASALLFGACHALSPTYFWLTAGMGAYMSALVLVSNSLLPAMAAHAVYDYLALNLLVDMRHSMRDATGARPGGAS